MFIIRKYFFSAKSHKRRELYVIMGGEALNMKDVFNKYFKKDMVTMAGDRVLGVRMAFARVLKQHYLAHVENSFINDRQIAAAIKRLQADTSSDIRQMVSSIPLDNDSFSETVSRDSSVDQMSTALNSTVYEEDLSESLIVDSFVQEGDMELEIMVKDAIDAAT